MLAFFCRPAERGGRGGLCPRASGSKGPHNLGILTTGNALKCILGQSKGGNRKIFCSLRSQGGLDSQFCPWASKSSRRPCSFEMIHFCTHRFYLIMQVWLLKATLFVFNIKFYRTKLLKALRTSYFTELRGRYHGVQETMTTPQSLT